jgi:RimJ/RimL family protein N-acetyltransferase
VRGPIAEVAFLFGPIHWGRGHATSALRWLHLHLREGPAPPTTFWGTTLPANTRSAALLERCGYVRVDPRTAPHLLSYDEGDLVYTRPAAETPPRRADAPSVQRSDGRDRARRSNG